MTLIGMNTKASAAERTNIDVTRSQNPERSVSCEFM